MVIGVRTCALPISSPIEKQRRMRSVAPLTRERGKRGGSPWKIGRASGRGRGEISGGAGSLKKRVNVRFDGDWSSDVCSSDLVTDREAEADAQRCAADARAG